MTDTPRTDAAAGNVDRRGDFWLSPHGEYVRVDFARELERELEAARNPHK